MRKIDRLMAILIALQQGRETAQSLANKLEVSKRTILRDMESLSEIGIPLYSTTGPNGGFRLMDGFQLSPLQLNSQEALTVFFALRAITKIPDTPFNMARWTVIDKLKSILPTQTLEQIEPVLERLEMEVPERNYKTPHLLSLMTYTSTSTWLAVFYRSQNHQRWLKLLPKRIYTAHGFWYCDAYSVTHGEERVFRVDRFDSIEEIDSPEIELVGSEQPKQDSDINEESIRIKAQLTYRGMLQVEQDVHIGESIRSIGDDLWEVDFLCPPSEWLWAVRFFFSLGLHAEVTEPESLRHDIYNLASQLCEQYKNRSRQEDV